MIESAKPTLDPEDWDAFEALALRIVSESIDLLKNIESQPVWRPVPDDGSDAFTSPLPKQPTPLEEVYEDIKKNVLPYTMGNVHPNFYGWYMGSSNLTGAIADFLAAIDASNLGGGNTASSKLDSQVVGWMIQLMGFPPGASGTLTSGGSMANMVGLTVARNSSAGVDVRNEGITSLPRGLTFYASEQAHSCIQKGIELLGLGAKALRKIPTNEQFEISVDSLRLQISQDREANLKPACIIGTLGTTSTGAIDDIPSLVNLAREEKMWLHIDGCIGALAKLSKNNSEIASSIELADSLAIDLHKLLHAPFEVGCAIVRDSKLHRETFALQAEYIEQKPRGAAAADYLFNYGFELSRSFKALKIWMSLREHGADHFGQIIDSKIEQAEYARMLISQRSQLKLIAPSRLNIVCFHFVPESNFDNQAVSDINAEIMLRVQESGKAIITDTTVGGQYCLRMAINNYRTSCQDILATIDLVCSIGDQVSQDFLQ